MTDDVARRPPQNLTGADRTAAAGVATALLAGVWTPPQMSRRVTTALGLHRAPDWVSPLVRAVADAYRDAPLDRPGELADYVQAIARWPRTPVIVRWAVQPTQLIHSPWPITALDDLGALARLLDIDTGELAWFADLHGRERTCAPPLRHYTWTEVPKRHGIRLLAAPKPRLKEIQRRLLRHVLAPIPLHTATHGGVSGRSVRTALEPHAGSVVVIRMDLTAFFASVPAGRVRGLLRMAGLPEAVARTVTGLLTTVAPLAVSRDPLLRTPHLPQGAPSSPQTANLVAYTLDRRLAGLAERWGASYTRYVDDLTISGGPSVRAARSQVVELVKLIVRAEGFGVNDRKTVVLGDAGRQAALGAVVNVHPALARPERDALRATLHNCVVYGWRSQARGLGRDQFRAHLLGRIAWAGSLHPDHGRRLRTDADRIDWS